MRIRRYIVLLICIVSSALAQTKLVVGYYPSWMKARYPHSAVLYRNLTHIAHAFVFPNSDGTLDLNGFSLYPELIQTAHLNGVGVVISVGGYDVARTPRFAQVAADSNARKRFAATIRDFCTTNGYDGVDIDWEYPLAGGRVNTTLFFRELRTALSGAFPLLTLSIAAPATDWNGGYDWTVMKDLLDWIGVMTYDFYGSWTIKIGPNSPLYGNLIQTDQGWIDNSVSYYLAKGVSRSKLLIGTAFYGWQFSGSTMYGPGIGNAQVVYYNIAPLIGRGWSRSWDPLGRVPYIVNATGTSVISYDDSASIAEKMYYVKSRSLGGTIVWALGEDYVNGQQPLLTTLGRVLTGITPEPAVSVMRSIELQQNYPNPFNGQTQVRYVINQSGRYSLRVYDLLGREVQELVNGEHQPGAYQVSCSSQNLPSGVYVYRLRGEGFTIGRTMIVLR